MEYKMKPCKVVHTFKTYEECAQYLMKNETQSEGSEKKGSYPFEKYFVKILRDHPVLYDEKHRKFGRQFPTKHAWSIVAGYMIMKRNDVKDLWATFQKFANSGVPLYVDLVNYVKLGDGIGWIDADSDSEDGADSAIKTENAGSSTTKDAVIKKEDAGSSSVNKDDCFRVPVSPAVKMDVE